MEWTVPNREILNREVGKFYGKFQIIIYIPKWFQLFLGTIARQRKLKTG